MKSNLRKYHAISIVFFFFYIFYLKTEKKLKIASNRSRPDVVNVSFADVTRVARVDIKRPRVSARVLAFRLCNASLSTLATRSIACAYGTLNNFLSPIRDIAFRPLFR